MHRSSTPLKVPFGDGRWPGRPPGVTIMSISVPTLAGAKALVLSDSPLLQLNDRSQILMSIFDFQIWSEVYSVRICCRRIINSRTCAARSAPVMMCSVGPICNNSLREVTH